VRSALKRSGSRVSGDSDKVLGRGPRLSAAVGNATYLEVAGADHFSLATDETVKEAVASFLNASIP
jgi:alpha/beta superfamily hydrolase